MSHIMAQPTLSASPPRCGQPWVGRLITDELLIVPPDSVQRNVHRCSSAMSVEALSHSSACFLTDLVPATMSPTESPTTKQSKWLLEDDAKMIRLRSEGLKWQDISKHFPGRSAISCRLRYQNYLERRSQWDENRKNKLAQLYERFKSDMWAKIATEMTIPWRAAEAMHWQIGEHGMAQRAGATVFDFVEASSNGSLTTTRPPHRQLPRSYSKGSSRSRVRSPQSLPSLATLMAELPAWPLQTTRYPFCDRVSATSNKCALPTRL